MLMVEMEEVKGRKLTVDEILDTANEFRREMKIDDLKYIPYND
jgi:hypothetical protein